MKLKNIFFITLISFLLLTSCGTALTPNKVHNTLPTLTESSFYNQTQASAAQHNNACKL